MGEEVEAEIKDISIEKFREYVFPDGDVLHIDDPLAFQQVEDGVHLVTAIEDGDVRLIQVAQGWLAIESCMKKPDISDAIGCKQEQQHFDFCCKQGRHGRLN